MAAESEDLLVEVFAQVAEGQLVEPLQLALVRERLDKRVAEAFLEVAADERADAVLLSCLLGITLGVAQSVFEVLLGRDGLAGLVLEAQSEVAQDPVEGGEVALDELLVLDVAVLELDVLGEVENEVEVFDGGLVDGAGGVVDETAGEEQCEREDLVVVVAVLVERAESLGVDHDHVDLAVVLVLDLEWRAVDPDALGAGVHGGAHFEPLLAVQDDFVEQVALAGAVHARHGHDTHGCLDGLQELDGFVVDDLAVGVIFRMDRY